MLLPIMRHLSTGLYDVIELENSNGQETLLKASVPFTEALDTILLQYYLEKGPRTYELLMN